MGPPPAGVHARGFTLGVGGSASAHLIAGVAREAGKDPEGTPPPSSRAPSLAETEDALAQAVWCWAGIAM